jgi:transcriptional regulator with GAF, ATPase, and Fis domain/multidrug efflux pump subunit AcrA (membrane-fusion protein)
MEQPRPEQLKIKQLHEQIVQLEKANRRLSISHQLTQEFVGQVKGVKHLISIVFDRVLETLDAEAGSLWLVDKKNAQNICHLAEGPAKKGVLGLRLPEGKGVVGAVIQSQEPEVILDCSKDERFSKDVDSRTGFVTRSMICVPLVIDDETYGAIQIVNKRHGVNGQFVEDDRKLVMQLAAGASLSVKNARILEMESRVDEMNVLMAISKEVVSTLDLDQVLDYVVNKTNELVDITGGAIALWNESQQELQLMVLSAGRAVEPDDDSQKMLMKIMEKVRTIKRSSYVADLQKYKETLKGGENVWVNYMNANELKAVWAMPMEDEEGTLGVVMFESDEPGFANGSKADLLHILASQATVALRNASLFKSIPFSTALSNVGKKGFGFSGASWKKRLIIAAIVMTLLTSLHYLPIFRWVSGPAIVEATLGRGVFLPLGGKLNEINIKEGQLVTKGQTIGRLGSATIQLQLLEAESKLAILERQIVEARADGDAAAMNRAAIEREAVRAKVIKARLDLEQIVITAPMDGLVLTPKPAQLIGRVFAMGDEIIRLADPQNLVIIVHVPETDLMDIEVGQKVRCVLRAQPGQYFTGKVRYIGRSYEVPSTALETSVDLEDEETKTGFVAEVEIVDAPFEVRPGMTGQALIHTEKTSVIVRIWRRISNFIAFNLGL